MTDTHHTDPRDAIEAFADGEPVMADALESALADPDGRAYLIDILLLRGLLGESQTVRPARVTSAGPASARRSWSLPAAAAIVVAGLGLGFAAGRVSLDGRGGPASGSDAAAISPAAADSAPAPTHVIHMENGVNWNETNGRSGGN
jgi:hypothetical protein